jgi:LacI family transcriptional regulator, sucrose operon repressor
MNKKIKLDDVARLAGVSKATASRVLNHRGYLSQKTIDKVHQAMEDLNYRPNAIARQLYKQETMLVGLIFPTINNPYFAQLEAALEKCLYNAGYRAVMGNSENNSQKEEDYLQLLLDRQLDGLIVGAHNPAIPVYHKTSLPIVSIERIVSNQVPVVSVDNYEGGRLATQRLLDDGCQVIAHTNYPGGFASPNQARESAYRDLMKQNKRQEIVYQVPFDEPEDQKLEVIRQIFRDHPDVDGVFADNDTNARLVMTAAKEFSRHCPEDLKVIGFDGADMTRLLLPELTTIQQPIQEMAEVAVEMLLKKMAGEVTDQYKTLPVKLVDGTTA